MCRMSRCGISTATTPIANMSSRPISSPRPNAPPSRLPPAEWRRHRNYIGVLSSVNCSATAIRYIADIGPEIMARYPNVDGVAFPHATGMATYGDGYENLCGCCGVSPAIPIRRRAPGRAGLQAMQIDFLLDAYGLKRGESFQTMNIRTPAAWPNRRLGRRPDQGHAAGGQYRGARNLPGERDHPGPAMRRLGRLFRHDRQPQLGARSACWSAMAAPAFSQKPRRSMARSIC